MENLGPSTAPTLIRGRRVLLPGGAISEATLICRGESIEGVELRHKRDGCHYDAGELLVLPGIVDLHGDAFERQIHPRAKVGFPIEIALAETDRQMIANGITTAFHGVTITWEPGARDIESARALLDTLDRVKPRLRCDTRVHLRHEVLSIDTVEETCTWMREGRIAMAAINDHSHMAERSMAQGSAAQRENVRVSGEEYVALAKRALARRPEVPDSLKKLTAAARHSGVPLASHDDESPAMRRSYRDMGCSICEFPADQATARAAIQAGDEVILGSPNILRGGSHCGRVGAAQMIGLGLCTALCSDYYYPAVLVAPFWLSAHEVVPFPTAWDLVSEGPARAVKLHDRGSIARGQRADLLFVDDRDPRHPVVRAVFAGGTLVHANGLDALGLLVEAMA